MDYQLKWFTLTKDIMTYGKVGTYREIVKNLMKNQTTKWILIRVLLARDIVLKEICDVILILICNKYQIESVYPGTVFTDHGPKYSLSMSQFTNNFSDSDNKLRIGDQDINICIIDKSEENIFGICYVNLKQNDFLKPIQDFSIPTQVGNCVKPSITYHTPAKRWGEPVIETETSIKSSRYYFEQIKIKDCVSPKIIHLYLGLFFDPDINYDDILSPIITHITSTSQRQTILMRISRSIQITYEYSLRPYIFYHKNKLNNIIPYTKFCMIVHDYM